MKLANFRSYCGLFTSTVVAFNLIIEFSHFQVADFS